MCTSFTDWNGLDSLTHYGVPGMKWGVRRDRVSRSLKKTQRKLEKKGARIEKLANKYKKTTGWEQEGLSSEAGAYKSAAVLVKNMRMTYAQMSDKQRKKIRNGYSSASDSLRRHAATKLAAATFQQSYKETKKQLAQEEYPDITREILS